MSFSALRRFGFLWLIFSQFCFLAFSVALEAYRHPVATPEKGFVINIYSYLYGHYETPMLGLEIFFFLSAGLYLLRQPMNGSTLLPWSVPRRFVSLIALSVLLVCSLGCFFLQQNFDLCIDEYLSDFQDQILSRGAWIAPISPEWHIFARSLSVAYIQYFDPPGYWVSGFLPGFAILLLPFAKLHLSWMLNPLLAAGSILLLAQLTRRIFPRENYAVILAVLLLACSTQFLAMAMARYAWTAHLFGSLLWLWLFTHPKKFFFLLTPLLGCFLLFLHQPQVHLLVAAPFGWRMVREGRWGSLAWFGCCYIPAALFCEVALGQIRETFHGHSPLQALTFPLFGAFIVQALHFSTLLAWSTPCLVPLAIWVFFSWRDQPPLIRDSALAVLLTFLFYLTFPNVQGHGWGYRYFQGVYGLLALVAAAGAVHLIRNGFGQPIGRLILVSLYLSLLVQFPYRAYEIRTQVRPMALTEAYLQSRPVDFVILETREIWYGCDLTRNDPWLQRRPLIFDRAQLTPEMEQELARRGRIEYVNGPEVKRFGVFTTELPTQNSSK